ncbi:flagellin N-terminal helical domain-containing protein [Phenylobacterium soli]|uniref:Flagellin n=1 Tax=Phenylobacterium soli TaxID=2170551 RepID=A0A328ALC7_9CAUL|nr:flagellin [Phenylobacterium soli]RAK54816.1 flagellin [Phenylobacterium soli]
MTMNSINTNTAAMIALQNLSSTQMSLATTQNRINTGLKIASAKDNGAIWAIAQTEKAQANSLDAVVNSLNNGKSVVDTTLQAGAQLTDLLTQMRSKALAASDATIDDPSRAQYASEFAKLGQSYANTIASATFNGVNLIDGGTGQVQALGSTDGKITVNSAHADISFNALFSTAKATTTTAGAVVAGQTYFTADGVTMTAAAWTGATGAADAGSDLAMVDTAMKTVTQTLSGFGVDSKAMDNQLTLVGKLQDSLTTGVGNLVDANLAQESASLQALQTKQQLGVQALSIANQSTSILLGLFK